MARPDHDTAAQAPQAFVARTLPAWRTLRAGLPVWLTDNEHPPNQWWLARQALHLSAQHPELLEPALGLALAAWQRRPNDLRFLGLLETANETMPVLLPPARVMMHDLRGAMRIPPDAAGFDAARRADDPGRAVRFALDRLGPPDRRDQAVTWLAVGFEQCMETDDDAGASTLLERFRETVPAGPLHSLADRLDAERELHLGDPGRAESLVAALDTACWGWWRGAALARLERARGDEDTAARRLARLWRVTPWHVNLALTLHDLVLPPAPGPARASKADTAVCIYSWNKADDLAATLAALAATDLGEALVVVLDNGSTDDTGQVLDRAEKRFRPGRFSTVRLPVNIGAPSARNWLLSLPELREARAVAFLDDDVDPPEDWLDRLLDAGSGGDLSAAGCMITDAAPPLAPQTGEVHLLPLDMCKPNFTDMEERLFMASPSGTRDLGLWAYRRRCVSVTGCCHLLSRDGLDEQGGFDVRFSPTQFDDLERDLRCFRTGRSAVYDGRLRIRHRQGSSLRQAQSSEAQAKVMGNKIKLERMFSNEDVRAMLQRQWDMLGADLEARLAALGPALEDRDL